jgi:hypothetical protein
MFHSNHVFSYMAYAIILVLLWADVAQAYLDPGTGSFFAQTVLAGILGAAFALKMSWKNVKILLTRLFSASDRKRP